MIAASSVESPHEFQKRETYAIHPSAIPIERVREDSSFSLLRPKLRIANTIQYNTGGVAGGRGEGGGERLNKLSTNFRIFRGLQFIGRFYLRFRKSFNPSSARLVFVVARVPPSLPPFSPPSRAINNEASATFAERYGFTRTNSGVQKSASPQNSRLCFRLRVLSKCRLCGAQPEILISSIITPVISTLSSSLC